LSRSVRGPDYRRPAPAPLVLCDASSPGMTAAGVYHTPYVESVEGYRHAYATKHEGIQWTRSMNHPPDPKCPGCAEQAQPTGE
jgi:hypothetical protein